MELIAVGSYSMWNFLERIGKSVEFPSGIKKKNDIV